MAPRSFYDPLTAPGESAFGVFADPAAMPDLAPLDFGAQPGFGTEPGFGAQPGFGSPAPAGIDPFASAPAGFPAPAGIDPFASAPAGFPAPAGIDPFAAAAPFEPAAAVADDAPVGGNFNLFNPAMADVEAARTRLEAAPPTSIEPEEYRPGDRELTDADAALVDKIDRRLREWEDLERTRLGVSALERDLIESRIRDLATSVSMETSMTPSEIERRLRNKRSNLGGLEEFLDMPGVADIMINSFDKIYIEDKGELKSAPRQIFKNIYQLQDVITRIAWRCGRPAPTIANPTIDGRFDYESKNGTVNVRASIALSHLTGTGSPVITLRKPVASGFDRLDKWHEDWEKDGGLGAPMTKGAADFMATAFARKANILIVGGTGSGKTSLMKALLKQIDQGDRVITVEDSPELLLSNPNAVALVAGGEDWGIDKLIQICMRMRPDRIIVGECRKGGEVMGFVQAVNTGHDGSITTTHASSAIDGVQRLLTLAARDGGDKSSEDQVAKLIAQGIDLIGFLGARQVRFKDGSVRRVRRIQEIVLVDRVGFDKGVPEFLCSSIFGRYIGDSAVSDMTDISKPIVCRGYGRVPQRFKDRMTGNGWGEDEIRALIDGAMQENPSEMRPKREGGDR